MEKSKNLGQITDIHNNVWDISVKTGLIHPIYKKVCFRHEVANKPGYHRYGYVDFYLTWVAGTNHIQILSGLWNNSRHETSTLSLDILLRMIEIAKRELL